jgi:quercetin dioxygenase-like cupin family protein
MTKPKITKLMEITATDVGGHEGFVARSLLSLPQKQIEARLLNVAPGGKGPVPPHSHPDTHFFLVLEGDLELEIDGAVHTVHSGCCVEVPPNCVHQLRCPGGSAMTVLAIKWS